MKFLIDTNVFIPLEPTSIADVEEGTDAAAQFARLVTEARHQLYLHPAGRADIARNGDPKRSRLRQMLFNKYPCLDNPPRVSGHMQAVLGLAQPETRDWVDDQLLAALDGDAVHFLVSEDHGLHKKARRLGVDPRVCTVDEAMSIVRGLFDVPPSPPPAVHSAKAYELDSADPIFHSLREEYWGFDEWLGKCKLEHRPVWCIRGQQSDLAAVCIVKTETPGEPALPGKALKMCTFKVSDQHRGFRYGELLLKPVFEHARSTSHDWIYTTVFEKHRHLTSLFEAFGFEEMPERTDRGEVILAKPLSFTNADRETLEPLAFNVRYGPFALRIKGVSTFVVPIRPHYHRLLFPEAEQQRELWPGTHPFGNSLRKAYLSNASIRTITPGANLLFYRSGDVRGVTALGVVEGTMVSSSAEETAQYVGKRTVYLFAEIEAMCERYVLAILFRQSRILDYPISLQELKANAVVSAVPQSIVSVPEEATKWLQARLEG